MKMSTFDLVESVEDEVKDVMFSSSTLSSSSLELIALQVLFVPLDIIISSPASEA